MRRIEAPFRDGIELGEEFVFACNWKRDSEEFGALDLLLELDACSNRAVVIVYIALRSRMGCAIASSTIRSIMSPCGISGVAFRAAIANSARLSSHGFGFTSMTYGVPSALRRMSMRA